MPHVNPTLPNNGESAEAEDITIPFLALLAIFNGHIGPDNLEPGAIAESITPGSLDGGVLTDGTVDSDKINLGVTEDEAGWTIYDYGNFKQYKKMVSGTVSVAAVSGTTIGTQTMPTDVVLTATTHFIDVTFGTGSREIHLTNAETNGTRVYLHARNNSTITKENMPWSAVITITEK